MENIDGKGLIGHRLAKKEVVRVEKVDDRERSVKLGQSAICAKVGRWVVPRINLGRCCQEGLNDDRDEAKKDLEWTASGTAERDALTERGRG